MYSFSYLEPSLVGEIKVKENKQIKSSRGDHSIQEDKGSNSLWFVPTEPELELWAGTELR